MKVKVTRIPVIQLRFEYINADGKVQGWNKKFQKPGVAAEHWADHKVREWEDKKFDVANQGAAYHRMADADWKERDHRREKLRRRSLPIFRAMLA